MMDRLDVLIKEYCPNGVERKPMWSITYWDKKFKEVDRKKQKKVINYPHLLADELFALQAEEGDVFLLSTGEKTGWTTDTLAGDNLCVGEVVTIPWGKSRPVAEVMKYYKGKFVTADNRIATSADTNKLHNKFLFYWMQSQGKIIDSFYRGDGLKHPSMNSVLEMMVPVPPLEVQEEIVRILDEYSEKNAQLIEAFTEELKARKVQYEYYMEKLLDFSNCCAEKSIEDVFEVITDYVAAGSFADLAKNVEYKGDIDYAQLVRTTDLKHSFTKKDAVYVDQKAYDFLWRVQLTNESIVLPNIGVNCGEVYYVNPTQLPHDKNVLGPNAILVRSNTYNNKFLFYMLHTEYFQKQLRKIISAGGQPKFNKTNLKRIKIFVPPNDVQTKTVETVENLEKNYKKLRESLNLEIELRQTQYEYYRDKLLAFEESK